MKVQRHVLRLNPASSLQDAMLAEKLRNEPFSFSSIVKVLLVNFYSINGGLCLDEESRIEVARIYPRCANRIKDAEDTPKKKPTPKPAKAPAAPAPAAEAVAPTVAASAPVASTPTEPAPAGDQVPRRKPPTYDELYADLLDAEF